MLADSAIDWTLVIDTALGVVQVVLVALVGILTRRHLRTPSGPTVGAQVEQANALSALAIAYLLELLKRQGITAPSAREAVASAQAAAEPIISGAELPHPRS